MKHIAVVAGNFGQFRHYIDEEITVNRNREDFIRHGESIFIDTVNDVKYFYVHDWTRVQGVHDLEFKYYGTYNHRPDMPQILEMERLTKARDGR